MDITLKLTEEQKEFLKKFSKNHYENSEENMATDRPIFIVKTRLEKMVDPDYEDVDTLSFYINEWGEVFNDVNDLVQVYWENLGKDIPVKFISFEEAYGTYINNCLGGLTYIADETDFLKAYNVELNYEIGYMGYYYEPVAYFFIKEEAEKYIEYQKHNLTEPIIYAASSGYRNAGEYKHFYDLLMSLGTNLLEENECQKA